MNVVNRIVYWISSVIFLSRLAIGTEFTLDLADNAEECFYEHIESNVPCTLEYQVSAWT